MIEPLSGKALLATRIPEGAAIVAFDGAVRSSKTVSSLLAWLDYLRTGPRGALLLSGRTETAIIANIVYPLQEWLGRSHVVLNKGTGTVEILGREHRMVGANDEQARTKIQGMTLAGAYLDEAANVPESFYNMLRSRLSVPGARLYLTTNPEGPKHWLLRKWLQRAKWRVDRAGRFRMDPAPLASPDDPEKGRPLALYRVTFVLDDNAWLLRTNPSFVAELRNSWPVGSVWHRRYIMSEWATSDGIVYDGWNEGRAVLPDDVPLNVEAVLSVGVDYGTTHLTRGYLLGLVTLPMGADGWPDLVRARLAAPDSTWSPVLVVLSEFAPPSATVGEHAAAFERWLESESARWGAPEWIAIDPAAKVFRIELHARGRDDTRNAHNAVIPGIQTVASLIATRRLYVRATCSNLVEGIPRYEWDTKATEKGQTRPVKSDDDEVDALRYAVYTSRAQWRERIPLAPISDPDVDEDDA